MAIHPEVNRMSKLKRAVSALGTAAVIAGMIPLNVASERTSLKGDIDGDSTIGGNDLKCFSSYLLGELPITEEQFAAADMNSDGTVDAFDFLRLRRNIGTHFNVLPTGSWLTTDSSGKKYYCFSGGKCTCINEKDGAAVTYSCSIKDNALTFEKDGKSSVSTISWLSSKTFQLRNPDGSVQSFRYYDDNVINYKNLLSGNWVAKSKSDGTTRYFTFTGISGTCKDGTSSTTFEYKLTEDGAIFHFNGNKNMAADIYWLDTMHFDIVWDDKTVERCTLRNIEVKDGITYVNGILIANKSYSLPSTYDPGQILPEAYSAFLTMQADAKKEGLNLWITSGYRSYAYQKQLYEGYAARDGYAAADTYSARPGFSEHQTGLGIDINVAGDSFGLTPESKWLAANCYKYGFIIRYPKDKQEITGYKYEPWHVRYLGKDLAKMVTDSKLTLEEYLCIDSVYKQ